MEDIIIIAIIIAVFLLGISLNKLISYKKCNELKETIKSKQFFIDELIKNSEDQKERHKAYVKSLYERIDVYSNKVNDLNKRFVIERNGYTEEIIKLNKIISEFENSKFSNLPHIKRFKHTDSRYNSSYNYSARFDYDKLLWKIRNLDTSKDISIHSRPGKHFIKLLYTNKI